MQRIRFETSKTRTVFLTCSDTGPWPSISKTFSCPAPTLGSPFRGLRLAMAKLVRRSCWNGSLPFQVNLRYTSRPGHRVQEIERSTSRLTRPGCAYRLRISNEHWLHEKSVVQRLPICSRP